MRRSIFGLITLMFSVILIGLALVVPPNSDTSNALALGGTGLLLYTMVQHAIRLHADRKTVQDRLRIIQPRYAVNGKIVKGHKMMVHPAKVPYQESRMRKAG